MDSSAWQILWTENFEVARPAPNRYTPIPPWTVPVQFDQPVFAISTSSFNALPRWQTAGWISQKINTGIIVDGTPDAEINNQRVFLNRLNLFEMPLNLASSYSIIYRFPRWIADLSLSIWQYTGNYEEDDEIKRILRRIEQKVEDISDYGQG